MVNEHKKGGERMADQEKRDKVIEGLEWCMNEKHDCYMEKGCPYENEGDDVGCKYALHRDALALLKAQEAVEPTWRLGVPFCSKCGRHFKRGYKYCPDCGKAVKWE